MTDDLEEMMSKVENPTPEARILELTAECNVLRRKINERDAFMAETVTQLEDLKTRVEALTEKAKKIIVQRDAAIEALGSVMINLAKVLPPEEYSIQASLALACLGKAAE